MSNDTTTPDLSTLLHDGDTVDLPDGRSLHLQVSHDDFADWNDQMDAECFGVVKWTSVHDGDNGHAPRPDDFDGAARKIIVDYPHVCWWQPPTAKAIGTVWDAETFDKEARRVAECVNYGWKVVTLTIRETVTDSRGGKHTVDLDSASLGGVEWDAEGSEYLAEILDDLYGNMIYDEGMRLIRSMLPAA